MSMSSLEVWVCALFALLASAIPLPVLGQEQEESRRLFEAGEQAYDRRHFAEAADQFERSYRLASRPRTLLRVAQSAEGAGQAERAVDTYKAYLVLYPNAPSRPTLEARIARLKGGPVPSGPRPAVVPAATRSAARGISERRDLQLADEALGASLSRPGRARGRWTTDDEAWYRVNRGIRVAGRIVTAIGGLLLIAGLATGLSTDNEEAERFHTDAQINTVLAGTAIYAIGSTLWAASTLRGTNVMRRRGVRISKVAAILSVVGLFCPPILWVAGPMAGANMRRAHDDLAPRLSRSGGDWLPSLQYRAVF